ncbi:WhiB family transcriptional regulator [Streptomyces bacillaris]|uniref:WhiB family transcriptional regulator n=1 Tax=Streptomyces bacillaris TaxID=68179 RepID=UPI003643C9BF
MPSFLDALPDGHAGTPCRFEPSVYFSRTTTPPPDHLRLAKTICSTCPVQPECLQYALAAGERDGIWGGLTTAERNALRTRPTGTATS